MDNQLCWFLNISPVPLVQSNSSPAASALYCEIYVAVELTSVQRILPVPAELLLLFSLHNFYFLASPKG
jgi:hypothetical protein